MKVLVIDDEDDIRLISCMSLTRIGGLEAIAARSGSEGIEKALTEMPDAILLDVMMPLMDGPTTLAELRMRPETAGIPVIFLTAKAMDAELERLRNLDVAGLLTKPFDPLTLSEQVRRIIEEGQK